MRSIEELKKEILLRIMSNELSWDYIQTLPKDDSLRTFICELGPMRAYEYARLVDKSTRDDTRKAVCEDPYHAYMYAFYVDKSSRDETRKAACRDPWYAYYYAQDIDKSPRDDTREAAYRDPRWKSAYKARFGE